MRSDRIGDKITGEGFKKKIVNKFTFFTFY